MTRNWRGNCVQRYIMCGGHLVNEGGEGWTICHGPVPQVDSVEDWGAKGTEVRTV